MSQSPENLSREHQGRVNAAKAGGAVLVATLVAMTAPNFMEDETVVGEENIGKVEELRGIFGHFENACIQGPNFHDFGNMDNLTLDEARDERLNDLVMIRNQVRRGVKLNGIHNWNARMNIDVRCLLQEGWVCNPWHSQGPVRCGEPGTRGR